MKHKQLLIVLAHAFVGWALCGATIAIGRATTTMENTLIIHAIAAPIIFAALSFIYFKKFSFTSVVQTAVIFLSFVVFMDVFIVALMLEKSFGMFTDVLGTWIPFVLIFLSTYLTGTILRRRT